MSNSDKENHLEPNGTPGHETSDDEDSILVVDSDGNIGVTGWDKGHSDGDEGLYQSNQPVFWPKHDEWSSGHGIQGGVFKSRTFVALGMICALVAGIGIGVTAARIQVQKMTPGSGIQPSSSINRVTDTGFTSVPNTIVVDVKGDVKRPGLVTAPSTARVQDVVALAGGFAHEQDSSAVNLAAPVDDGEEIVIPNVTLGADPSSTSGMVKPDAAKSPSQTDNQVKIDLNTADAKTLETIPGIGPTKANAIIDYRQTHGLFHTVADLNNVKGIGPVTYSKIAPYVVIMPSN